MDEVDVRMSRTIHLPGLSQHGLGDVHRGDGVEVCRQRTRQPTDAAAKIERPFPAGQQSESLHPCKHVFDLALTSVVELLRVPFAVPGAPPGQDGPVRVRGPESLPLACLLVHSGPHELFKWHSVQYFEVPAVGAVHQRPPEGVVGRPRHAVGHLAQRQVGQVPSGAIRKIFWIKMVRVRCPAYGDRMGRPLRHEIVVAADQCHAVEPHVECELHRYEGNGATLVQADCAIPGKRWEVLRMQEHDVFAPGNLSSSDGVNEQGQRRAVEEFRVLFDNEWIHADNARWAKCGLIEQEIDLVEAESENVSEQAQVRAQQAGAIADDDRFLSSVPVLPSS